MDDADFVKSSKELSTGNTVEDSDDVDHELADYQYDSEDSDNLATWRHKGSYTILSQADIRKHQEKHIMKIITVLCISRSDACNLLCRCNWSLNKVFHEWFDGEETIQKAIGLLQNPVVEFSDATELTCGRCSETFPKDGIHTSVCGHPFCSLCWAGYVHDSIRDGPGCLLLQCPDPTCSAVVGGDKINLVATEEDREMYARYFLRSYVEGKRKVKWCPATGCNYAVDFADGSGSYDVTCRCSYSFCWKCTEEAHHPIDCGTVAKWGLKYKAETEHIKSISADSKKCPKCHKSIEKNQGAMHITCMPSCYYEFCWICLGPWTEHGQRNGKFYSCNSYDSYEPEKEEKSSKQKEREDVQLVKNVHNTKFEMSTENPSLERYTHYCERWEANQSSGKKAMEDLQRIQNLEKPSELQYQPESLALITEAWSQIVECRRILKWTYAYGYYLPKQYHAKIQVFQCLQGKAEAELEQLHHFAENKLQFCLHQTGPSKDFTEFCQRLDCLTSGTWTHFLTLVKALENELSDAVSRGSQIVHSRNEREILGTSNSKGKNIAEEEKKDDSDDWACNSCTYSNLEYVSFCYMCDQERQWP